MKIQTHCLPREHDVEKHDFASYTDSNRGRITRSTPLIQDKHSNLSSRIKIRRVDYNVVKFKTKKKIDLGKTINLHPNSIDAQEYGHSISFYVRSLDKPIIAMNYILCRCKNIIVLSVLYK